MVPFRPILILIALATIAGCGGDLERLDRMIDDGQYARAEQQARAVLAAAETRNPDDQLQIARILDRLVLARLRGGKFDDPETTELAERAVALKRAEVSADDPELCESLDQLGCLLGTAGDTRRATELFETSLDIRERAFGEDSLEVSWTLNFYAPMLWGAGDYAEARHRYERALAIRRRLGSGIDGVLNNLGVLAYDMGDYDAARRYYTESLERRVAEHGEHPQVATAMANLALVHWRLGELAEASRLATEALEMLEGLVEPGDERLGIALLALGDIAVSQGDPERALPRYERALRILGAAKGQDNPFLVRPLLGYATALRETSSPEAARARIQRAVDIAGARLGADHPYTASSRRELAAALLDAGEPDAALRMALLAEAGGRRHLRLTSRAFAEDQSLRYSTVRASGLDLALTLAASGVTTAQLSEVADAVIRSRVLVLDEMAARHRLLNEVTDPEVGRLGAELARARTRLANLLVRGVDDDPDAQAATLDSARQAVDEAEARLAYRSAPFRRERELSAVGLEEVLRLLPPRSALVSLARYRAHVSGGAEPEARYIALVLRAGATLAVPLADARSIDGLVERWRRAAGLESAPAGVGLAELERAYRAAGSALREAVWDPIARRLGDAELVFVVPDGLLATLSLATLPTAGGTYLVESGPKIHYLSAERDLVQLGDRAAGGSGLLAMGAPDFDVGGPATGAAAAHRGSRVACGGLDSIHFGALPQSKDEIGEIGEIWRQRVGGEPLTLTGPDASEARFKREAPGRRAIHVATHGFFLGGRCDEGRAGGRVPGASEPEVPEPGNGNPLTLSGLAFAGANRRAQAAPDEEDGVLTAEELTALDLAGVEWMVLSACDTGLGEIHEGEGVLGLRRAVRLAGAHTLIMSLWSVDDTATRRFMAELYGARLGGASTVDALRQASLARLRARRLAHESTHPFFWGAFIATGGWN